LWNATRTWFSPISSAPTIGTKLDFRPNRPVFTLAHSGSPV
jgi:hypothetical protein